MSQKTILSFFSKTPVKPIVQPVARSRANSCSDSDSEDISKSSKAAKKRCRIASSSEDDEEAPKKKELAPSPKRVSRDKKASSPEVQRDTEDTEPALRVKKSPNHSPKEPVKSPKKEKTTPKSVKPKAVKESNEKKSPKGKQTVKSKTSPKSPKVAKSPKVTKSPNHTKSTQVSKSLKEEISPKKEPGEDNSNNNSNDESKTKSTDTETKPKAISSFFAPKKELKVQSAGAGHSGIDYNPAKAKYHPVEDAFWKKGEKVPYLALTKTFATIEEISGRLRMIEVLANFFRSVIVLSPTELVHCIYLCQNQLAPAYEGIELGIAETSLMKVIAQTTGRTLAQVRTDSKETGDLGLVAEQSKSNQRMMFVPAPLTVAGVFAKLTDISKKTGAASNVTKVDKIQSIFVACRHSEARYFIRSLLGKLRIGLAEQSVLQAIALACTLTPPELEGESPKRLFAVKGESAIKSRLEEVSLQVKTTYCQCPNFDRIVSVLLSDGVDALLEKCQMMPGTPLKPMLAHPTKGIQEVLQRFDGIKFTCEWKYDGERAQIHISETGSVSIYSRNQENNTSKYPDIIGRINSVKGEEVRSCILDCEAVAWDSDKKQILPFQILSTRKRKDATEADIKVKVCVFMFDLLYLNGEPLVTRPFQERRSLLQKHFREHEGEWQYATSLDTSDMDELQNFLEVSIKGNCEGLMVKTLEQEATYEIAKRSRNWLKIKKDYLSGVGDSLDLVVLGGYHGKGKRTGTYGGFLLACYDAENEQYQSICKIGTGFSDEDLANHTEFLKPNVIKAPKSYYCYDTSHEPDVWFEPVQVWEVLCADLSLSPVHQAAKGIIDPEKGISLRFPRFIRIRDDKAVEDATSAQQVADMYSNQDQIKNQDKVNKDFEEDFY